MPATDGKGGCYHAPAPYQPDGYEEDLKEPFLHGLVRVVQEDQSGWNESTKHEALSTMAESGYETTSIAGKLLRSWQQNAIPDGVTNFDQAPGS